MQHQNKEFYRIMVPRNEYPRPQFERTDWLNLNGEWTYAFDFSRSGDEREWRKATSFEGRITVPFCPESRLSGVGFTDFIEMMWYHRKLEIPAEWADRKILLHFGGVDYKAIVYLDGTEAGRHTGGTSPFTVDLTGKASREKRTISLSGWKTRSATGSSLSASRAPRSSPAPATIPGQQASGRRSGWRRFLRMP